MSISDKNLANEDFWCNLAAESIYGSSDRRAKSVESLKSVIVWAFALFATGGFAISLFGPIKNFNQYALGAFGIAFCILTIAYAQANEAQYPIAEDYKPADPIKVAKVFTDTVKKQTRLFKIAAGLTSVGFFFLALGILLQFANAKSSDDKIPVATNLTLTTSLRKQNGNLYIPIAVKSKKNDSIWIDIVDVTDPKHNTVATVPKLLFSANLKADTNGVLYYSYSRPIIDSISTVKVTAYTQKTSLDTLSVQAQSVKLAVNR